MGSKAEAGWVWADRPRISRLGTERGERPFIVTLDCGGREDEERD